MQLIDPTAVVEEGAELGNNVIIEPYAVVKKHVRLGDNVTVHSHAYIDGHTTIGEESVIYPFASIGMRTQAKRFQGETTYVKIGKRCQIRESVTINASFDEGSTVTVGDDCLIMAYCHIAHHCKVGNHVIMANSVMLAGSVEVGDYANIGGMTPVHQFVRIGTHAMVGGFSRVVKDIPPYTLGAGDPYQVAGLNLIGLKRRNFDIELRRQLTKAFKLTYRSDFSLEEALQLIERELEGAPIRHWLDFCRSSKRGLIGLQSPSLADEIPELKDLLEE